MTAKLYFTPIDKNTTVKNIQEYSKSLLEKVIKEENIELNKEIPLKVHFGEKGNTTFVKPDHYDGVIDFLKEKGVTPSFIETNVMYAGHRHKKSLHLKTAKEHGFTRIPIIIADGDNGEHFYEVEINKNHFKTCKLGKEYSKYNQMVVLAHFKGHMLAGFGGAIKQLAMGFASRGGKVAQHMDTKPRIKSKTCKQCNLCLKHCPVNAITINDKSSINHEDCIGCAACTNVCNHKAITMFSLKSVMKFVGIGNPFGEKVAEYAYAAQKDKNFIYMNFIMNITPGCDCEGRKQKILMEDIGIIAGTDPVAIDQACFDMVMERGKKFRGAKNLKYAEEIGLGTRRYEVIPV